MSRGPEKCSPGVVCALAASNRIEYVDYRSVGYGRYYQMRVYSVNGDDDPVRIKYCPFCGTKLVLPRLPRKKGK